MIGEKIIIQKDFNEVARKLKDFLLPHILKAKDKFILALSGESGSGKTSISFALSKLLSEEGLKTVVIQQDDYTVYQPGKIVSQRRKNLAQVGLSEVQLALLEQNLQEIREGKRKIEKPLVILNKNQIINEVFSLKNVKVVIVEGIYSFVLENVDKHIFIDRTYAETKEARELRGREEQDELMEKVLKIEHGIVLLGKPKADLFITKNFELEENSKEREKTDPEGLSRKQDCLQFEFEDY